MISGVEHNYKISGYPQNAYSEDIVHTKVIKNAHFILVMSA